MPSVLPPAGDEPDEALDDDDDRADKGEGGRLVGADGHVHAPAIRRDDNGERAAIEALRGSHGPRSLRAQTLNPQPDDRSGHVSDGPVRSDAPAMGRDGELRTGAGMGLC